MNTFYRHAIRTQPITDDFRQDIDEVSVINRNVKYETTYGHEPNILDDVVMESDDDIDERWLHEKTKNINAHSIFLHLTDEEWERLGIRPTLWGQTRLVDGKIICYGRWHENARYQRSEKYPHPVNQISEMAIGIAHEERHKIGDLTGDPDTTHYHFYGQRNGERWAATPTPQEAYDEVNWDNLPELRVNVLRSLYRTLLEKYRDMLEAKVERLRKKLKERNNKPRELQPLVQEKAEQLMDTMEALGYPVRITSGFRSLEEQRQLYEQGRSAPGNVVTNARPGESMHNHGVAIDFVFTDTGYDEFEIAHGITNWELLGINGKALGFEWGGDWSAFIDLPHFELTFGHSISDFQKGRVNYQQYQ